MKIKKKLILPDKLKSLGKITHVGTLQLGEDCKSLGELQYALIILNKDYIYDFNEDEEELKRRHENTEFGGFGSNEISPSNLKDIGKLPNRILKNLLTNDNFLVQEKIKAKKIEQEVEEKEYEERKKLRQAEKEAQKAKNEAFLANLRRREDN